MISADGAPSYAQWEQVCNYDSSKYMLEYFVPRSQSSYVHIFNTNVMLKLLTIASFINKSADYCFV